MYYSSKFFEDLCFLLSTGCMEKRHNPCLFQHKFQKEVKFCSSVYTDFENHCFPVFTVF